MTPSPEPDQHHHLLSVDGYLALPIEPADRRLSYGDDPSQFGDLFLPSGTGPYPVVVLLHGGCWRAAFGLEQLGQLARALNAVGFAVWNLEYRRVGNGGGWPNTFLDVAHGADFLSTIALRYNLDLEQIIAAGHSAGGHLALWLAARSRRNRPGALHRVDPLPIHGVVSLAGIPDLRRAAAEDICRGMVQELMGGAPDEVPDRYAEGSPAQNLPLGLPHIHVNGDQDATVPPAYVRDFVGSAVQEGDESELIVVQGVGHFEIVVAASPIWSTIQSTFSKLSGRVRNGS